MEWYSAIKSNELLMQTTACMDLKNPGFQKVCLVFPCDGSSSAQLSLTSLETILLGCIVTAVISAFIEKNIRIGEFWGSHFNIEDGR